jgi:hypothetical protein
VLWGPGQVLRDRTSMVMEHRFSERTPQRNRNRNDYYQTRQLVRAEVEF